MAWTAPITFVANTALTAAQLNTYLRDNMNETAPALATTPGYHFVTESPNKIVERAWESAFIDTGQTLTEGTDWSDLSTVGPQVTVTTGSKALWIVNCFTKVQASNVARRVGVEITGATSISAADNRGMLHDMSSSSASGVRTASAHLETGLTPGTNTFTMKYKVHDAPSDPGIVATFSQRELIVIGL